MMAQKMDYIGQEKADGKKVDGNTVTNALGSAAVVGGTVS